MKKIWQLLQMQNWKRMAAAGAAVAVIAAVAMVGGENVRESEETTTMTETTAEVVQPELPVNEEEAALISELYKSMAAGDYDEAANILNGNVDQFEAMMLTTLGGEKYRYSENKQEDGSVIQEMERVTAYDEFEGMVLTRYNTVFFGEFSNGMPNGTCVAIQTMVLDHPRYSFAEGTWENGKLNGEGSAGYQYYQAVPESGFARTEKRGFYRDNLLDGDFVYATESGNGETLTWEMKAVNGVTVITPEWEHYPFRKEYMLGSAEDAGRAYVLSEDKVASVLWNNLIVWD